MRATKEEMQQEALSRAATGQSLANWPTILAGFLAKGIPESDIRPRENVFTYHAWRALGRQVRRGEHGVKVMTYVAIDRQSEEDTSAPPEDDKSRKHKTSGRRPWMATVFHVSQTDPIPS
jgi:hypothetical protein